MHFRHTHYIPGHFAMTSSPSSKAISFTGLCTTSFGLFAGEAGAALAETLGVVGAALADTFGLVRAASAALALALALLEGRPRGILGSWQVIPGREEIKT